MSLQLNFEPHGWYMGFAIGYYAPHMKRSQLDIPYYAVTDNGNTYMIDSVEGATLNKLRANIRAYHLKHKNGYGERIASRRLKHLREEIEQERISQSEIFELQSLKDYIKGDILLLEWAGVPEQIT